MIEQPSRSVLDRSISIPGWFGLSSILILVVAAFMRLFRLDVYLLNAREANWAYDAWSMYYGRPLPIGQELPDSGPFMLIWNSLAFFLFGTTDATARIGSAVLGIALIGAVFLLKPFLSKTQLIATAGILAISPTMVFASRTIEPGMAAAFFALLVLIALLRCGTSEEGNHGWPIVLGLSLAGLYATGPIGVTTIISLGAAILAASVSDQSKRNSKGAVGTAVRRIGQSRDMSLWTVGSLIIGLLILFSRVFSDFSSLTGIATTISDWVNVMASGASNIPAMFYFWSLMLYETAAVVIAIITAALSRHQAMQGATPRRTITPLLYVVWSAAALLLQTAASSRDTGSAVLVALPVLLLAGAGLGRFLELGKDTLNLRTIAAALAGLILVVYSTNAMIGLAFTRGETGSEPLAHDIPTAETRGFLDQVMRLSRDLSVNRMTHLDPTGRFGLTVQVTPEYEWPFTWYFREFADFEVTPAGGFTADTDVAIAANAEVMDNVGLTPWNLVWINKPGDPLTMMRSGDILRTGLNPANWGDAWNYMINRDSDRHDNPRTISVGYSVRVMNKINLDMGPFNLFDGSSPGAGAGLGQLDVPTGIGVGEDGTIYVLNAGNVRIDRFDSAGRFLGIWNGQVEAPLQLSWIGSQGGTGLHVGPDGLIYIADTWNHAVVVVNPNGTVVRVLGNRGTQVDITDGGDPMSEPGLFFGPRDIAISEDRIFVTDTGNERVQVFAMDGTFITAFGGYGEADGQFIEPTGIAIAPDGTVWVADSGNARLQVFSADGTWVATHEVSQWREQLGISRMNMLAFDKDGTLYFTTPFMGVWSWTDGQATQVPGVEYVTAGGIAVDEDGDLLITDTANATVERVPLSDADPATATPVATPEG